MVVLDANILVRAVLGKRVRGLLEAYAGVVHFLVADAALGEARLHLPGILMRRGLDAEPALAVLNILVGALDVAEADVHGARENDARQRLLSRDESDWPTVAVALTFDCAVWTEDADFFGTGIGTWTTDRVEIHLRAIVSGEGGRPTDQ